MREPLIERLAEDLGRRSRSCTDVAQAIVRAEVAPCAAVGWAYLREGGGWETSSGAAMAERGSDRLGVPYADDAEPIFDLASVTKPMTALAVACSAWPRETPLADLLAESRGTPSAPVSIEAFLAHRAGLVAHVLLEAEFVRAGTVFRSEALRAAACARRPDARGPMPAGGFAPLYSDLGYWLAGEALARSSGARDAAEVIEHGIVARIGRSDDLGSARTLEARGIGFRERVVPTEVHPGTGELRGVVHDENARAFGGTGGEGHAGMFGTIGAVLSFGCAAYELIERGQGALARPNGSTETAWLVAPRPGGTLRAGFDGKSAEGSSAGERASARAYGHLGFTGTSLWIDPLQGIVVACLTNRVHPTRTNLAIRAARPMVHDALLAMAERTRSDSKMFVTT